MELITIIVIFLVLLVLRVISTLDTETIKDIKEVVETNQIYENSYNSYASFYGQMEKTDPEFKEKITKIYNMIINEKCEDIKEIAKKSHCTYQECVIKIQYLKYQKIITNYYLDHQHGYIKKCSAEDKMIVKKYSPYIYSARLQPKDIAIRTYHSNEEDFEEHYQKVKKDLKNLIDKDLLEGVIYNEVDNKLIYYTNKKELDTISIACKYCGAVNDIHKGNKERCEYCNSIIDSDEIIKNEILKEIKKDN